MNLIIESNGARIGFEASNEKPKIASRIKSGFAMLVLLSLLLLLLPLSAMAGRLSRIGTSNFLLCAISDLNHGELDGLGSTIVQR